MKDKAKARKQDKRQEAAEDRIGERQVKSEKEKEQSEAKIAGKEREKRESKKAFSDLMQ